MFFFFFDTMSDDSNSVEAVENPRSPFEEMKKINEFDSEYWSARELMTILDYTEFGKFKPVINKAITACKKSGQSIDDHFSQVSDMITIGKGGKRTVTNYHLSRYACYLIVQNADSSKEMVALGQTYFAVQTHRQEEADRKNEDLLRINIRNEMREHNKKLVEAAKDAGVNDSRDYAIFQNHGYQGLYGGLGAKEIACVKGLKKGQQILDHMGSTELAANLFRATQAEDKLRRERIQGRVNANQAHYEVGKKVRQTITELGGTMPEDLPSCEDIKKLERRYNKISAGNKVAEIE